MWTQDGLGKLAGVKLMKNDTHARAEKLMIEGYRRMSATDKFKRAAALSHAVRLLAMADIRRRHPEAGERDLALRLASRWLDAETMLRAFNWDTEKEGF